MGLLIGEESAPSTPSSGFGAVGFDGTASLPTFKSDGGVAGVMLGCSKNVSTASQGAGFATDTYVTNSGILVPSFGVQAGTVLEWLLSASKTAAGTDTPVYSVRIGANQTTADTARLQITGPAQTAAADVALIRVVCTVRNVGASGVVQGTAGMSHNLAATGFANDASALVEATSAAFDNSALGGQYIGLSINGGASAAWTVTQAWARAWW